MAREREDGKVCVEADALQHDRHYISDFWKAVEKGKFLSG